MRPHGIGARARPAQRGRLRAEIDHVDGRRPRRCPAGQVPAVVDAQRAAVAEAGGVGLVDQPHLKGCGRRGARAAGAASADRQQGGGAQHDERPIDELAPRSGHAISVFATINSVASCGKRHRPPPKAAMAADNEDVVEAQREIHSNGLLLQANAGGADVGL